MSDTDAARPSVAVFRPADERITAAIERLESLGLDPVPDPMLAVEPTGAIPRPDADLTVLTSKTGVELAAEADWQPGGEVVAIGDPTADALREAGYTVDVVPTEFSSSGLVEHLGGRVDGLRVEVARSDHGAAVLTEGLERAGAYVHETILYRLVRPPEAGDSVEMAAAGDLDAVLFTSSLTVEHFLEAAADRGVHGDVLSALDAAVVGAIGQPTRETAESRGLEVDVLPTKATFDDLARAVAQVIQAGENS